MTNLTETALTSGATQGKRRNRKGAETRQRVLNAAITCLHKSGYANTSIETVMGEAGLSRGSVLNQFPTRLDLMSAAAGEAMSVMIQDTWQQMAELGSPRRRLEGHLDVIWHSQNIPAGSAVTEILLASRWDHELAERLKPIAMEVERNIDRLVEQIAIDNGIVDVAEYQLHVRVLILSLRGVTIENMYDDDREIMRRALDRLRQMHKRQCERLLP